MIEKNQIIDAIKQAFINDNKVQAFWLEGSSAFNTSDEYSDIDIWFDVNDGYEDVFISILKSTLLEISTLDYSYEKQHDHPYIRQMFFHLEDTSPYLIIDTCIQLSSREEVFVIENTDEKVEIIFDKCNVIKFEHLDMNAFTQKISREKDELISMFDYFTILVKKEIERGNFLEALNYYHKLVLKPIIELARIKYEPTKKGFYLKHIRRDLPTEIVSVLENLYAVSSIKDIQEKMGIAIEYMHIMSD